MTGLIDTYVDPLPPAHNSLGVGALVLEDLDGSHPVLVLELGQPGLVEVTNPQKVPVKVCLSRRLSELLIFQSS